MASISDERPATFNDSDSRRYYGRGDTPDYPSRQNELLQRR